MVVVVVVSGGSGECGGWQSAVVVGRQVSRWVGVANGSGTTGSGCSFASQGPRISRVDHSGRQGEQVSGSQPV
jgi:hypothetical protein